jgi:hemolysin III
MVGYPPVGSMDDYTLDRPRLRGRLHQVAFFVSVPAGVALVVAAASGVARFAATVFAISLSGLYAASAAFHRIQWRPTAWMWMRRLDHAMIFVLIAGSYTPFALLVLEPPWSTIILATVWGGAVAGIVLRLFTRGVTAIQQTMYLVLGWVAVLTLPVTIGRIGWVEIVLLFSGGILYTVGAIFFNLRKPGPEAAVFGYHEFWHSMVIGGSLCHYALVFMLVVRS